MGQWNKVNIKDVSIEIREYPSPFRKGQIDKQYTICYKGGWIMRGRPARQRGVGKNVKKSIKYGSQMGQRITN